MTRIPTSGSPSSFKELLDSWKLYTEARGFSDDYIGHMRRCVGYFADFLPPNAQAGDVTVDDYRRFISHLRERTAWDGRKSKKAQRLTGTTINTYSRAIRAFFAWLEADGRISDDP
jgi:site-specific recombinase XerD